MEGLGLPACLCTYESSSHDMILFCWRVRVSNNSQESRSSIQVMRKKTRSLGSRLIFQEPSCHNPFAAQKSYEDTAAEGVDLFESELGARARMGLDLFLRDPHPWKYYMLHLW